MDAIAIPQHDADPWWAGIDSVPCSCGSGFIEWCGDSVPGWRRCETCGGLWVVQGHGPARRLVAVLAATVRDAAAKQRQRDHGGTAPGKPKNTGGKIATSESEKARDAAGKASDGKVAPERLERTEERVE